MVSYLYLSSKLYLSSYMYLSCLHSSYLYLSLKPAPCKAFSVPLNLRYLFITCTCHLTYMCITYLYLSQLRQVSFADFPKALLHRGFRGLSNLRYLYTLLVPVILSVLSRYSLLVPVILSMPSRYSLLVPVIYAIATIPTISPQDYSVNFPQSPVISSLFPVPCSLTSDF